MGPAWARATVAAAVITLLVTPLLRRLALATGFVDQPAGRKLHTRPVPYLGGVGLITSVLLATLFEPRLPNRIGVLVLGGAVLGTIGLIDDHRTVSATVRFLAQAGAALTAIAVGLRIHATGVTAVDVLLTLVWIVGITNAFNLLDNMDGLAAGVSGFAAAAVFALGILGGQPVVATVAAAVAGACLAFLVYNRRPASVFMGDAGSLFLGFVIALLTVDIDPALAPPASFAVPVMLLALPILDTSTVTLARLRRGRSVSEGGKDHLSHRLVALGLSTAHAVLVLVSVQAALGVLAVLAGRGVLRLTTAVLLAAATLALLSAFTARATVYSEPVIGMPGRVKLAALLAGGGLAVLTTPALVGVILARSPAEEATAVTMQALASMDRGDTGATAAQLRRGHALFSRAADRASGPLTSLGLLVPGMSSNLKATRMHVNIGRELTADAAALLGLSEAHDISPADGSRALDELRRLEPLLGRAVRTLATAHLELSTVDAPYLIPSLRRVVGSLAQRLDREHQTATTLAELARVLPSMAGADGTYRYLLTYQDSAVLRATGGLLTTWGVLVADRGVLSLAASGSIDDLRRARDGSPTSAEPAGPVPTTSADPWSAVNTTPDFATVSRLVEDLYRRAGGEPVNGVIAVDAVGLRALLDVTGPIAVAGISEPLSSDRLLGVLHPISQEGALERASRVSGVVQAVWRAFTTAHLSEPARLAGAIGRAVRGGHLLVHSSTPEHQAAVSRLGAGGWVLPSTGDSLLVVNQNLSGVPADLDLHRRLRYDVRLDPQGRRATVTGGLDVVLENRAPPSLGENRTSVTVYNPLLSGGATLDGSAVDVTSHPLHGQTGRSAPVSIPPLQSRTVRLPLRGHVDLEPGGWYRLHLLAQPSAVPADVEIDVSVPAGWRIAGVRGGSAKTGERRVSARLRGGMGQTLEVRVDRSRWARLWNPSP